MTEADPYFTGGRHPTLRFNRINFTVGFKFALFTRPEPLNPKPYKPQALRPLNLESDPR